MSSEKIVITSALPYANGEIHLGHVVSTYLPADIFARYCRMKGYEVVFTCATDDYGTPILIKAEQEGKTPKEYVEYWNKRDLEDFTKLGISFDFFYKTSSEENLKLTQYFFLRLYERGYIYSKEVEQPYCEKDKKFLPDRYVVGKCPYCGAEDQYSDGCEVCGRTFEAGEILNPRCILCGSKPVAKRSLHYFFKLSLFSERLKAWLEGNKNLQSEVKNYVLKWIESGLRDWDITRDITWGVPIPLKEAVGKVLYGWFDNHLCYISTTLKYLESKGLDGKRFWNSARIYHFIGKDIVYHHYLFLPAMRMGLDEEYALPTSIPTRGHLLLQGQKFSKSRGWYVSLKEFLKHFPPDYLRYYLSSITPYSQADVNFDWREYAAKINNELVANIGNFIYRVLSFIYTRFDATIPRPKDPDDLDKELIRKMKETTLSAGAYIEKNELDRALKTIVEFSTFCNQYFQRKEPWKRGENAANCLYYAANATRSLAILLHPYIPYSTEELWRQLALEGSVNLQPWDSASDLLLEAGHKILKPKVLFRKISDEELEPWLEKFKGSKSSG
ncbi:MAG: methionine--tRNA ligase [Thaumarchaeota archaeon]|nr:methionine--tRNA ligase [Nitrososphaerota archaeon]